MEAFAETKCCQVENVELLPSCSKAKTGSDQSPAQISLRVKPFQNERVKNCPGTHAAASTGFQPLKFRPFLAANLVALPI